MARKNVVKPIVDEAEMATPAEDVAASHEAAPFGKPEKVHAAAVSDVAATLAERGKRYGDFAGHAEVTQELKDCANTFAGWKRLNRSQRESLEMIFHKIGRILNGDPNYADSWHDIAGYAKLVEDQLNASAGK